MTQAFLARHLVRDAAGHIRARHAAADRAFDLHVRRDVDDDDLVVALPAARFEQQRRFDDVDPIASALFRFAHHACFLGEHDRVNEGVQLLRFLGVGEGERGELLPIDLAIRQENARTVRPHDRFVASFTRAVEPRDDGVGVDRDAAEAGQHAHDGRLPAGDAAGEANAQHRASARDGIGGHHPRLRFAASTVFFISIAIVIGPTPPGTGVIHDATSRTRAKSTSPTSTVPFFCSRRVLSGS